MNLREQVEKDLSFSLEGDWGLPVELISPDGVKYSTSENSPDPENPLPLMGQVLYDQLKADPDTGEPITINNPIVVLRRTSLARIPADGETWSVRLPTKPSLSAALENFILSATRPHGGGQSIGYTKLYAQRIEQL